MVSEMTKSLRVHYIGLEGKDDWRDVLQTFFKSSHWRRRRDVLRQLVPQLESLVSDGWKTGVSDDICLCTDVARSKKA